MQYKFIFFVLTSLILNGCNAKIDTFPNSIKILEFHKNLRKQNIEKATTVKSRRIKQSIKTYYNSQTYIQKIITNFDTLGYPQSEETVINDTSLILKKQFLYDERI